MSVTIEFLKKETISLASIVEHYFLTPSKTSEIKQRQKELYNIHKNSLKYLVNESLPKKRNIRFINALINISRSLIKIYQTTDKMKLANSESDIFKIELSELKIETSKKIQSSIDSFSYLDESMALKAYSYRSKLLTQIEFVEKNIMFELEESPGLTKDGLKAIKTIYYLKQIDEEVNEIIENVLYIDKRLSPSWEADEKVDKINMLDFIHTEKMINTRDYHE